MQGNVLGGWDIWLQGQFLGPAVLCGCAEALWGAAATWIVHSEVRASVPAE